MGRAGFRVERGHAGVRVAREESVFRYTDVDLKWISVNERGRHFWKEEKNRVLGRAQGVGFWVKSRGGFWVAREKADFGSREKSQILG